MSNNKVLNLFPIDYPFETLVQRADSNPPKLILNPEFQRKYKWDKDGNERASKFIESCLMRIPLPACYFAENDAGFHEVIDGVQRITTIKNFFNDRFRLEGLTVFKELEGKLFSEIGESNKNELSSTTIRCIILRKENDKELVQEIFARLNQGAVTLSSQEIRHAIHPGSLNDLLIELGKDPFIENFKKGASGAKEKNSREQEEMVLRYFAMQNDLSDYEGNLSKYLDKYTALNQKLAKDKISDLRNNFKNTLNKCSLVFGDKAFVNTTKSKKKESLAVYDLLMWGFTNRDEQFIKNHKIEIAKKFNELCEEDNFEKTMSGGLQSKSSILRRRDLWRKKLESISLNE